jgi:predicted 3-demethylubiquinone-9 3-methyltransferase (glyoxalase superfamily)
MTCEFELSGSRFMALNAGPMFQFTEAISFFVSCEDQEEVDYYWERLLADGGTPSQCGWLKDKFGLSWQIIPRMLGERLSSPDRTLADKTLQNMLQMTKIEIAKL